MDNKLNISDEFIYDSFVKTSRFHITITISTIGIIIAQLTEDRIVLSTPIILACILFVAVLFLSILGQLRGTIQTIEKRPIDRSDVMFFLGGFWILYVPGVSSTIYYLAEIAK